MNNERSLNPSPLILERPLFYTIRTKIDAKQGTLTMRFDRDVIHFNIFEVMKYLSDSHTIFAMSVIDLVMQKKFKLIAEMN